MASTGEDYYRVLGVPRDASRFEIRRAYRRLARRHHPDRNPQPDGPERFRALAEAYEVLNHPVRRAHYDHNTERCVPRETSRAPHAAVAHRGVLELSPREAQIAATRAIRLFTTSGMSLVLPAGIADGDQVTIQIGDIRAVLAVRVDSTRKT